MTTPPLPTALDQLLLKQIAQAGSPILPTRPQLNFAGDGVLVTDDAAGNQTTVVVEGGGGSDIVVRARILNNVALSGIPSTSDADGVSLVAGDPVVLTEQTSKVENGPYAIASGAWTRLKLTAGKHATGARVWVDQGYYWRKTRWECTSDIGADVVGTNDLTWRRQWTLLDDLPLDSHDLAYYIVDESGGASIDNRIPGGPSYTLTSHDGGVNYTRPANLFVPGPFNGKAIHFHVAVDGYYGADNVFTLPDTFHMSVCVCPTFFLNGSGNNNLGHIVGRTRKAPSFTPFSGGAPNTTEFAAAMGALATGNANSYEGGFGDTTRKLANYVNIAGTMRSWGTTNAADDYTATWSCPAGSWHLLEFMRDNASGVISLRRDGTQIDNLTPYAGSVQGGSGTGYLYLGMPKGGGGVWGLPCRMSHVRIMDTVRDLAWSQERYRRMTAWMGGG